MNRPFVAIRGLLQAGIAQDFIDRHVVAIRHGHKCRAVVRRLIAPIVAASLIAGAAMLAVPSQAKATLVTYLLTMDGAQEVPGGTGDPNGTAMGTIDIDDSNGMISWNFTYADIDTPLSAMHIHNAPVGSEAGPFVDLGVGTSGGAGTLISFTTTSTANAAAIISNPTDYYINIHNTPFPDGAVRGQLGVAVPEPSAFLFGGVIATAAAVVGVHRVLKPKIARV
jgi:hypothetical protein